MREAVDERVGTVCVTVSDSSSRNPLLNIVATMTLRSLCKPAHDQRLVRHIQRLALIEKVEQNVVRTAQTATDDQGSYKLPERNSNYNEGLSHAGLIYSRTGG